MNTDCIISCFSLWLLPCYPHTCINAWLLFGCIEMNTNFVYRSTTFFSWNQYFLYCWLLILLRFTTRDKPNYHCTQHITCPHVIKAYSDCNLYKRYRIPICNKNCHATPSLLLLEQFPRYLNLYIVRVLTKITKQSHTVDHLKTSISSYIIVLSV